MYNLHLSAEQLEFRDTVRGFVDDEVKPVTLKADRLDLGDRSLPMDVLRKASQMGLRTLALPEDLGGVGADALTCCIVTEELAVGDADVAAVLTRDLGAGAAAVRGDDAGAARALPAGVPGGRRLSPRAAPAASRATTARSASTTTGRPPAMRLATTASPRRRSLDHQRRQGLRRQRAGRQADRGRGADRQGRRRCSWCRATRRPHRHRAARAALVSRLLRPARAEGLSGCRPKTCWARRRARRRPRHPPRPGAQPRHRPRRLRGRAGICAASRAGRPAASSSTRRSARSSPTSRSGSTWRATRSGARPGPSDHPGRLRRPQPARPAAHHHRQGVHRRGDLSRRQGRRRMLRRHGRDARHAAAEIHPRRAASACNTGDGNADDKAAHRRGAGRATGAAPPMLAAE